MSAAIAMRPPSIPMLCRAGADDQHLRHLNEAHQSNLNTASGQLQAQFDGILIEINSFRDLRYGWDGDDGNPISTESIEVAKRFILSVLGRIGEQPLLKWNSPTPCADPDGGVELYWEQSSRWLELLFQPGESTNIHVVKGDVNSAPIKQEVSPEEAMSFVTWVLGA